MSSLNNCFKGQSEITPIKASRNWTTGFSGVKLGFFVIELALEVGY